MSDAPPSLLHAVRQHVDYALSGIVRKIPFFKDIKDVGVIASMFHLKNYEEGYVIFREGEQGTAFYIIIEGECCVTKLNDASETELLATLKKGDFFGEVALLRQSKRRQQLLQHEMSVVNSSFDRIHPIFINCSRIKTNLKQARSKYFKRFRL